MPSTNQNAIVALVLAIGSWIICPVILAIVALFIASNADKEIKASNGWSTGSGYVTAAKVFAWINIAITILAVIFFGAMMLFIATNPDIQHQILESPNLNDTYVWPTPSGYNG